VLVCRSGFKLSYAGLRREAELQRSADNGDADAAYELGSRLAENPPGWWILSNRFGWVRRRRAAATRYLRQAADAGDHQAAAKAGRWLVQRRDWQGAEHYLRQAVGSGDPAVAYDLGKVLARIPWGSFAGKHIDRRQYRSGLPDAGRMLVDGAGWLTPGDLLAPEGRYGEAIAFLRQAADLGHLGAAADLGMLLLASGQRDLELEAERYLRLSADRGYMQMGRSGWFTAELAALLAREGRYGEAERYFRKSLSEINKFSFDYPYIQRELGRLLERRGQHAEAAELFRQAASFRWTEYDD
jgi:tetratricopeptide (TPR) repeat protein